MNMNEHYQGLGHIAVRTADMDASIAFYERIGGRLLQRAPACPPAQANELALVELAGFTVELIASNPGGEGVIPHIAICVDDVDKAAADLKALGVDTFMTGEKNVLPSTFGGLENWFFTGPSGEQLELLKML